MPRLVAGPPSHTAPSTYKLAPAEAFIPESVTATFDGTGAGGTFLPTLSVYSQDGKLIARSPATQITAGNSAEVTFAPLLRAAVAAAAAGTGYPLAVSNINGFYNVTTGAAVQIGVDDGNIATESPAIFATAAHATPGLFGIGITGSGTYAAFWTVNYVDTALAPVANPQNFVNFAEDASGSLFSFLPALGSLYARGYVDNVGRSAWDVSWIDIFSIHGSTAANDPIIISAQQATGVTLRAYTNVWVLQLTTTPFS